MFSSVYFLRRLPIGITLAFLAFASTNIQAENLSAEQLQNKIATLSKQIADSPKHAGLYVERGDAYFLLHQFDKSIDDYNAALKLDDKTDMAYFGRGMALGRAGFIEDGIKDISVYIQRHPDNSRAYTKRGVRHLWLGNRKQAEQDLRHAIELDPRNAEAHDDLGVILAQRHEYKDAISHFSKAVSIDPTYQKAHHNLAMGYYLTGQDAFALVSVDNALKLNPNARDSVMLKSVILRSLGRDSEADALKEKAEFMPEGNWSERSDVQ